MIYFILTYLIIGIITAVAGYVAVLPVIIEHEGALLVKVFATVILFCSIVVLWPVSLGIYFSRFLDK